MPGKRKPFIDKNRSVTFRLVHRSQKDPFIADTECGDRVLAPVSAQRNNRESEDATRSFLKRKDEQAKFGIYFDDDYDYLQHLRDANEVVSFEPVEPRVAPSSNHDEHRSQKSSSDRELRLPATLFECRDAELKVGLLNQAAPAPGPHPNLDPDIVAILDDDEGEMEFEELEDDFMLKANALKPDEETENGNCDNVDNTGSDFGGDRMGSDFSDDDANRWNEEETRSRFTEYSLTSSVIRRTEGLQHLDARFEKIYEEYDDSEVGSLESDEEESDISDKEVKGLVDLNSNRMLEMAEEFEQQRQKRNWLVSLDECTSRVPRHEVGSDDEDESALDRICVPSKASQWDCESIISTYSNICNHPTLIKEERSKKVHLDPKTGLPVEAFKGSGLTKKNLEQLSRDEELVAPSVQSVASTNLRAKDETPEERRARKQVIKMERRERRCEKKANTMAFKDEKLRRKDVDMNLRQNMQGLKLS